MIRDTLRVWDLALCTRCNRALRFESLRWLFRRVSRLGDGLFWYVLMLGMLLAEGARAVGPVLHMIGVGIACTLVYKLLKSRTLRPRPYQVPGASVRAGADPLDAFSFPSGHTLHAVSFTWQACAHFPELGWVLLPLTALIAGSRVVLGLHYPSDVLAGATIGAALAELGLAFA